MPYYYIKFGMPRDILLAEEAATRIDLEARLQERRVVRESKLL
jgi:hypothetical protein